MDQQICDINHRIILILTDVYLHYTAVLFHKDTVHCKRKCYPLVFFHSSIVMGIQICQIRILVQWVLLDIQTRRINMGTEDIHTLFQSIFSNVKQRHDFFHSHRVNFVSDLQSLSSGKLCLKSFISGSLRFPDNLSHTFSLRFTGI